jgi:hypothetical protein
MASDPHDRDEPRDRPPRRRRYDDDYDDEDYDDHRRRRPDELGESAGMRFLLPVGRSGLAIAAGYLGLFSLIVFPAPLALLFGLLAIRDMNRHPEKHGMGRAVFGVVMGAIGTAILVLLLLLWLSETAKGQGPLARLVRGRRRVGGLC